MKSKASSVDEYLAALPPDRREALSAIRRVILDNMDSDYEEGMQYGMIGYFVPHRVFPDGYHCDPKQPLNYVSLASQKSHMALYMMCVYASPELEKWLRDAYAKAGKKLDLGKSCIRFKKLEEVPLPVIRDLIRRTPAKSYLEIYKSIRDRPRSSPAKPKKPKKA